MKKKINGSLESTLKVLLYVLLIVFPLGVVVNIEIISSVRVYPVDVVLGLIFIVFVLVIIIGKLNIFNFPLFKEMYLFIAIAFIALMINLQGLGPQSFLVSLSYLLRIIIYSSLIFSIYLLGQGFSRRYLYSLSFSGFVFAVLGLVQYIFYPDLRNLYYLGWDKHFYRVFSTFLDPNFTGAIYVLEIILILYLLFINLKNKKKVILLSILLLVVFSSLLLTYSRSTYVSFLFAVPAFFIISNKRLLFGLTILLFLFGLFLIPKNIKSEGVDLFRTNSVIERINSSKNAFIIFKDSPFLGVGFNAYRYAQEKYGTLSGSNWERTHSGAGVSNSFLFILATTGILGFICYAVFWRKIFKTVLMMKYSGNETYFKSLILSSILAVFVHSLFENTLFYPFIMIWLFVLLGIMESKLR
ncbi:O-antigen ligase domain-containing protein [Candidatus Parcubacteria bacterium]|nr:MAG: O-antigen ligase domain-containing protein [Candidatus Parcubacteria bacterium]